MNQLSSFDVDGRGGPRRTKLVRPCKVTPEEEQELFLAMEEYKRSSGRMFPTYSEILEVLRSLGYAKRVWRPIEPVEPVPVTTPVYPSAGGSFRPMGEDDSTGLLCWFSWVETPAGV